MNFIKELFSKKQQHLTWFRFDGNQVVVNNMVLGETADGEIKPQESYYVVRMNEMYLRTIRRLWQKYYPMLHGFVEHGGSEEHAVVGPGQLREFGDANLDRIVNLNVRLAGPTVYAGSDVTVTAGLYSVPGEDAARILVSTLGSLAALAGIALGSAQQITEAVKSGVENVLGLKEAELQLGIRDSFFPSGTGSPGNPLRAGYYVSINAPASEVDPKTIWLRDGRLFRGANPFVARPYEDHDYMVLQIQRQDSRSDWAALPGMAEHEKEFQAILANVDSTPEQKRQSLSARWPAFVQVVTGSPYLTHPDKEKVKAAVLAQLKNALAEHDPFATEFRSIGATEMKRDTFDLLDVADALALADPSKVLNYASRIPENPFL